ncbi:MAG: hypothetical protein R3C60_05235 [Parvularculaceae bacterium]
MAYERADGLRYLFIDFNAFFAAVEQHDDPALFGRPVAVIPLASEHTSAIAVSYEARRFGIKRGTKVRDMRALCPSIIIRQARHDRYVAIHHQIMAELDRHLPLAKIYSIDEAAFHLGRGEASADAALIVAKKMRRALTENVGPALRASIGLAQTRLLAKLAAESHKPDGLTVLAPDDLPGKLNDMPLRDIPGVGAGVAERLRRSNIHDFPGLWRLQPKHARRIWGSVQGERFWYALHGYEVEEPDTKKSMIGHSRVLSRDHESAQRARIVARALLLKAAGRLRHHGFHASCLSLSVRMRPEGRWESAERFAPTQDNFDFLHSLDALWNAFLAETRADGWSNLRLGVVTIYLHSLYRADAAALRQGDLFADDAALRKSQAGARLWKAVDMINADPSGKFRRLGANASRTGPHKKHVMLAGQQGLDLNYLGAKIAFSRVPDAADFLY